MSMNIDPSPSTQMPAGTRRSHPGTGLPPGLDWSTELLGHAVHHVVLARVLRDPDADLVPADRFLHLLVLDLHRIHPLAEIAGVAEDVDGLPDREGHFELHCRDREMPVVVGHDADADFAGRGTADRRLSGLGLGRRTGRGFLFR